MWMTKNPFHAINVRRTSHQTLPVKMGRRFSLRSAIKKDSNSSAKAEKLLAAPRPCARLWTKASQFNGAAVDSNLFEKHQWTFFVIDSGFVDNGGLELKQIWKHIRIIKTINARSWLFVQRFNTRGYPVFRFITIYRSLMECAGSLPARLCIIWTCTLLVAATK